MSDKNITGIDEGNIVGAREDDDTDEPLIDLSQEPSPKQIVKELDRYIIGQEKAKKSVAIALRNRWRRQNVEEELREEIMPNNIIMIGPTGVGKTEIARRLARLAGAPFIKVEASKFTEVGYIGRDVESIIRELVELSVSMVRNDREDEYEDQAGKNAENIILDLLLPPLPKKRGLGARPANIEVMDPQTGKWVQAATFGEDEIVIDPDTQQEIHIADNVDDDSERDAEAHSRRERIREKLAKQLADGKLEDRKVEIEISNRSSFPLIEMLGGGGLDDADGNFGDILDEILPRKSKRREVSVAEARRILTQEELQKLIDMDEVISESIDRVEQSGIVFIDEIDKIAGPQSKGSGPDVSREGVQRDLLPIVEGSNVPTKYGLVRTDHILFIAAGAFHTSKPSDLIPELQGRFPIRVELDSLTEKDFCRILTEPRGALIKQYKAILATEGAITSFSPKAIQEIAHNAWLLNQKMENIGARRLQTVLFSLMEDILFELPELGKKKISITRQMVMDRLLKLVDDEDLRNYIL